MIIDAETLNQFLAALTALILIIIAWYNKQRTDLAAVTATAATQTAVTNQAMAAAPVPAPVVLAPAPVTKMTESTKAYMVMGETEADQKSILAQIAEAERLGKPAYTVYYEAGWFEVENGAIRNTAHL